VLVAECEVASGREVVEGDDAELVQAAKAITTGNRTPSRHRALRLVCRMRDDGTTFMTPTTTHSLRCPPGHPLRLTDAEKWLFGSERGRPVTGSECSRELLHPNG
jgi:hypothetical protein